jgi:hypothetical protein
LIYSVNVRVEFLHDLADSCLTPFTARLPCHPSLTVRVLETHFVYRQACGQIIASR